MKMETSKNIPGRKLHGKEKYVSLCRNCNDFNLVLYKKTNSLNYGTDY